MGYDILLETIGDFMQNSLFDDLKALKAKLAEEEKVNKTQLLEVEKQEKEKKLQDQFLHFMKESGIKKLS